LKKKGVKGGNVRPAGFIKHGGREKVIQLVRRRNEQYEIFIRTEIFQNLIYRTSLLAKMEKDVGGGESLFTSLEVWLKNQNRVTEKKKKRAATAKLEDEQRCLERLLGF